jgi:nicotinate-nucleotide pyrophosphorylase (carboxylating)
MMINKLEKIDILDLIHRAIEEDLGGYGDITSKYLIPAENKSRAYIICKEESGAVLSGIDVVTYILEEFSDDIEIDRLKEDGVFLKNRDIICYVYGPTQALLAAERTCLNFLQHMSGIATYTRQFADIAAKYDVKIADTRKTKPTLRKIEKYAVLCGGGFNHRFGLFDGILIKDNHIVAAGGVKEAIQAVRNRIPHQLKIEVEVKNLKELEEAIGESADIIMLDNMDPKSIKDAAEIIRKELGSNCLIEVSGGIGLSNVEDICKTGIDIVSVGSLTHSAPSADFSLEFE